MTITEPIRVYPSDGLRVGGLFEPTTVRAVWRMTDCDESISDRVGFLVQLADYLPLESGTIGKQFFPAPFPAGGKDIETAIPANRLTTLDPAVGFEVVRWDLNRVPNSRTVWEVSAELQLLEYIPGRGHTIVTKTTRSRSAQAWRVPYDGVFFLPAFFYGGDPAAPIAIGCDEVTGLRVDVNGQPMQVELDQHVMTVSFVIRAPYHESTTGTTTVPPEWTYWTTGLGSAMVGNRNEEDFFGWPAYSLVMESLSITQIGQTTFHRVDMVLVHDQWWHNNQFPATLNGSMPPVVVSCESGGETTLFQTNKTLWINHYLVYSDFNDFMSYVPYDSRAYMEDAIEFTGTWPY